MGKIVKIKGFMVLVFLSLMLSACKDIEHVFIFNKTNKTINIKIFLDTTEGEQIMETDLEPNKADGWEYEIDSGRKKVLDNKLKLVVVKDYNGCEITLNRSEILNMAEKDGMWKINIDNEVLNCK